MDGSIEVAERSLSGVGEEKAAPGYSTRWRAGTSMKQQIT
jgi:hypothetical protein